jgi:hypothetical protein
MSILGSHRAKALWGAIVIVPLLFTGCAGIEPYQPRDYREEGLEKGLFSGSEGEFVIFRKASVPETDSEGKKIEAKSGEQ